MSFRIPPQVFGKPVAGAMERLLSTPQPAPNIPASPASIDPALNVGIDKSKYLILPTHSYGGGILGYPDLLVSMDRLHLGKNWNDAKTALTQDGGATMLNPRQFVDFLTLLKSGSPVYDGLGKRIPTPRVETLLNDIIEVRDPYRAEWLGAQFTIKSGTPATMVMPTYDTNKATDAKIGLGDYLTKDKTPGIDLVDWLAKSENGLPHNKTKKGDLYYWQPADGAVARFYAYSDGADLGCDGGPRYSSSALGVRAVRAKI